MITNEILTREQNAKLIIDFFHRIMMHHVMWFSEVYEHLGKEKAFKALNEVYKTSYDLLILIFSQVKEFTREYKYTL